MGVTLTHFLWALNATCDLKFHLEPKLGVGYAMIVAYKKSNLRIESLSTYYIWIGALKRLTGFLVSLDELKVVVVFSLAVFCVKVGSLASYLFLGVKRFWLSDD